MSSPPVPTTLSSGFRLVIGGVLFICAVIFVLALHGSRGSNLANIRENTDGWWTYQTMPTPRPVQTPIPVPAPRPLLVLQTPPRPSPMATPKAPSELWLRYRRAIETGMGQSFDNVREVPQLNGQPAPNPTPNIFAYGAYPQP